MRRFALLLATVLGTLTLVVIAWQLRSIVLLFVVSLVFAAAVSAPIRASRARGLPLWRCSSFILP